MSHFAIRLSLFMRSSAVVGEFIIISSSKTVEFSSLEIVRDLQERPYGGVAACAIASCVPYHPIRKIMYARTLLASPGHRR